MIGLSHVIGGVSYDRPLSHDKGGSHMIGLSRVIGGVSHMVGLSAGRGGVSYDRPLSHGCRGRKVNERALAVKIQDF